MINQLLREAYEEFSELHIFLQGFDASGTGALESSFDVLVERVRDNAAVLAPFTAAPIDRTSLAQAMAREVKRAEGYSQSTGELDDWIARCPDLWKVLWRTFDRGLPALEALYQGYPVERAGTGEVEALATRLNTYSRSWKVGDLNAEAIAADQHAASSILKALVAERDALKRENESLKAGPHA